MRRPKGRAKLSLVGDIDLLRETEPAERVTLNNYGASSVRTQTLLKQLGRNEVFFVRGKTQWRGRLVMNLDGAQGVFIPTIRKEDKYSLGIKLREVMSKLATTQTLKEMFQEDAQLLELARRRSELLKKLREA